MFIHKECASLSSTAFHLQLSVRIALRDGLLINLLNRLQPLRHRQTGKGLDLSSIKEVTNTPEFCIWVIGWHLKVKRRLDVLLAATALHCNCIFILPSAALLPKRERNIGPHNSQGYLGQMVGYHILEKDIGLLIINIIDHCFPKRFPKLHKLD